MSIIKKILTLQLLAALLCSQVGYYFFYSIKQYKIKEEVKQKLLSSLPENKLQIFNYNNKNIVWEEEEKECSIDGIMYDIAKIKIINGTKYLYCLSDEQETILLTNFVKSIDNKKETKQQKENKISLKLSIIYLEKIEAIAIANFFNKTKNQFPALQQKSVTAIVSINIPPPKFS